MSDMNKIKDWVNNLIRTHNIVVFSKSHCPYCQKAIQTLNTFNPKDMHVEQIENNPNVQEIQNVLKDITGKSSVPRIFINNEIVGGCDDLLKEFNEGKLKERLNKF